MAPSFLILHGIENHRPPEHWQFWLAEQLRERGHAVAYPALPDPDAPYYLAWAAELRRLLKDFDGAPRSVVCHSLACLLWLRAAAEVVRSPVDRLLLVSPPASASVPETGASFRLERLDIAAVRATITAELAIACSDADPYNPEGAQRMYGDALGVDAHVFPGAGHITPDDGYGPWPWALQWCLAFEEVPGQTPSLAGPQPGTGALAPVNRTPLEAARLSGQLLTHQHQFCPAWSASHVSSLQ